jgi:hypothetical protein
MILPITLHSFLISTDYQVFHLLMVLMVRCNSNPGCSQNDARHPALTNFIAALLTPLMDYVSVLPLDDIVPLNPELKSDE